MLAQKNFSGRSLSGAVLFPQPQGPGEGHVFGLQKGQTQPRIEAVISTRANQLTLCYMGDQLIVSNGDLGQRMQEGVRSISAACSEKREGHFVSMTTWKCPDH